MAMPSNTTAYPHARHRQSEGTLVLSNDHLCFRPTNGSNPLTLPWRSIEKHQVSPASHPKSLVKINLNGGKSLTFRLPNRQELDRVRRDISNRLHPQRNGSNNHNHSNGKKRSHISVSSSAPAAAATNLSFGEIDATALAVTRSSLLAANPTLRAQHRYLVTETQTVSEDDFWKTHQSVVEEEYAKICGTTKAGTSSLMQSFVPLQGRVTLGVEEMRQIFILYPAVHKAYEEKVPLELSDEQFWRKYLESEFFHRDRGRLGTAARNHSESKSQQLKKKKNNALTEEEQDARAAAVRTDDLFSRYDAKLRNNRVAAPNGETVQQHRKWGTHLAVGQFDLASTFETERGQLLEGPRDIHPPNQADDGKGSRVVQKYNRHWAMVLHPDEAVAGSNLMEVARRSVRQTLEDDPDAKANGGIDEEMTRLVNYANTAEEEANHVQGWGVEDEHYSALNLSSSEGYFRHKSQNRMQQETEEAATKRRTVFANAMAQKMQEAAVPFRASDDHSAPPQDVLPPPKLGKELLSVLTKRMASDAKTEADRNEVVNRLDEEFKEKLHTYFRRSSELLRHFYGLRKLSKSAKKLIRIVEGLEAVYREVEAVRKALPQNEEGEVMRTMCLPIMEQLDWAFKQHRDTSGSGGGGGFVTVEDL